jgi:predicted nucleotidyltransferase
MMEEVFRVGDIAKLDLVAVVRFGSQLYGTSTPESDTDIKGVFFPSKREVFLGKIPKTCKFTTKKSKEDGVRNTKDDLEIEVYSLPYFLQLACEGQTVALDMLHTPENMTLLRSDIWDQIVVNREKFYTKNLKAFVGYAKGQAARYGTKGSRLNISKDFLDIVAKCPVTTKLYEIWNELPVTEHSKFIENSKNGVAQYQINGKVLQATMTVFYAQDIVERYYNNYGKRAELAAKNEGVDFKAVSHAMRAALEVEEILKEGKITFPLKDAEFIRNIKQGERPAQEVLDLLEKKIAEVEELSKNSNLPSKVDIGFWDDFLFKVMSDKIRG